MAPRFLRFPFRSRSDPLETLHWLYSVEQRSVIPIKWLVLFLAIALILFEDRALLSTPRVLVVLGAYTATNLLFTILFLGRILPVERFRLASYLSLAADLFFVASLILFTSGLRSDFYLLFILLILRSAAMFQDPKKKFMVDLFMTFVYLACSLHTVTDSEDENLIAILVFRLTLIWGVIVMSWFLLQVLTSQQARILTINDRLRYQLEQNREMLSAMTDAVLVFNPSLQLRICNLAAESLIASVHGFKSPHGHFSPEEHSRNEYWRTPPKPIGELKAPPWEGADAIYKFWSDFPPDLIGKPIERLLEEVRFRPEGRIYGQPITLEDRGGEKRSFLASVAELGAGGKERLGWMVLLRDISEYESLEAQLLSSEKLAAVGKLAAGLAHELGNPLGIIKSCGNFLLKKTDPDSDLLEETQVLASEAERCQKILRQLLDFASQEQLRLIEIDLSELVRKSVNLVAYQATDSVKLSFDSAEGPLACTTDENLLTQALVNLLLNAVESIEGEGEVETRLEPDVEKGFLLTIRDTGCGMGRETIARLFEPFYTTKKTGTGLGLSITQRILDRLGGAIDVQSEPGKGTTFYIRLPTNSGEEITKRVEAQ